MNQTQPATFQDRLMGFALPQRHARGRVVRLDEVAATILAAHDYPPAIRHLLAEALVLAALVGGLGKEAESQMTMQAQTGSGIVSLLVCDYRNGELRGYAQFDAERLTQLGTNPSLTALFGEGFLAITFDLITSGERYQGIVPLEGATLAEACERYFIQSEQAPTLIRLAVHSGNGTCTAGGLLVQHLPEGEEGRERLFVQEDHPDWEHIAILAGSTRHDELVNRQLPLEDLVWRLFHEEGEIRVTPGAALTRGCRCSAAYFESVIARFPADERETMRNEDGLIVVDCAFCSRLFPIRD